MMRMSNERILIMGIYIVATCQTAACLPPLGDPCGDKTCPLGSHCDDSANVCLSNDCGDRIQNLDEECDTGDNTKLCDADCSLPSCGDGFFNPFSNDTPGGRFEECDTGGNSSFCDADCTIAICGDSFVNAAAGEQCDDGNTTNGDGCSATCQIE